MSRIINASKTGEMSVDIGDWNFYILFKKYINGYYIALPDYGVCVKATNADDVGYNMSNLSRALDKTVKKNAKEIALAIQTVYGQDSTLDILSGKGLNHIYPV